jgi:hypothetical protein
MITYDVVSASLKHIKNANKIEGVTNSSNWYISLELEDPDDFYATAGQYIIMDTSKTHRAFEAWKELFKAKCLGEDEKFDKTKDYTLTAENIDNPKMKQIKGVVFMSKVLPQPMVRKYTSTVKDSKGVALHKPGDWIVGRNGKIKMYTTVSICCRMQRTTGEDGETVYDWAPGEDPETVMGQQIASFLYPLEEAGIEAKAKAKVDAPEPEPEPDNDDEADDEE